MFNQVANEAYNAWVDNVTAKAGAAGKVDPQKLAAALRGMPKQYMDLQGMAPGLNMAPGMQMAPGLNGMQPQFMNPEAQQFGAQGMQPMLPSNGLPQDFQNPFMKG